MCIGILKSKLRFGSRGESPDNLEDEQENENQILDISNTDYEDIEDILPDVFKFPNEVSR